MTAGTLAPLAVVAAGPLGDRGRAEVLALVTALGSSRYAERDAADRRLRAGGELTLAAVPEAARTTPDPEVRERAAGVRDATERERFGLRRTLAVTFEPYWVFAVSPDGREVAAGGIDLATGPGGSTLAVWDAGKGRLVRSVAIGERAGAVAYHPAGRVVAVGSDRRLATVDTATGEQAAFPDATGTYSALAYTPDGGRLPAATGRGAEWWGAATRTRRRPDPHPGRPLHAAAVRPDGRVFAVGGRAGTVRTWAADSLAPLRDAPAEPTDREVLAVAFTPDGRRLAVGTRAGTVRVYDADTGALGRSVRAHPAAVRKLAFAADGRRAAIASEDGTVGLWDADTWERTHTYRPGDLRMYDVAFAPDRPAVYAVGEAGRVYEWAVPR